MKNEGFEAALQHEIAELRARFPAVYHAGAQVERSDGRYSVCLDVRLPQHQALVSGPLMGDFHAALRAAFDAAASDLARVPWTRR
jgi:hypothetical protein